MWSIYHFVVFYLSRKCWISLHHSFSFLLHEQKTRYETYISLLQAKVRAETDDLEKIEASVVSGLIMEGALASRECHLRKTKSSPAISLAHCKLNGKMAGSTDPGQKSWGRARMTRDHNRDQDLPSSQTSVIPQLVRLVILIFSSSILPEVTEQNVHHSSSYSSSPPVVRYCPRAIEDE